MAAAEDLEAVEEDLADSAAVVPAGRSDMPGHGRVVAPLVAAVVLMVLGVEPRHGGLLQVGVGDGRIDKPPAHARAPLPPRCPSIGGAYDTFRHFASTKVTFCVSAVFGHFGGAVGARKLGN